MQRNRSAAVRISTGRNFENAAYNYDPSLDYSANKTAKQACSLVNSPVPYPDMKLAVTSFIRWLVVCL